jgi:hypothetical protein
MPTDGIFRSGGLFHGVQLWVNLPAARKFTPPRYQDIRPDRLVLLTSADGGSLVRVIAGSFAGHDGPGVTYTPISYAHASLLPGARFATAWEPTYNALVYVMKGSGTVGAEARPIRDGQLAIFGPGDALTVTADGQPDGDSRSLEILLLGGRPIGEPVVSYGPFVMNTREEIIQAIQDYQAGRMGVVPAVRLSTEMGEPRG